ncbi:MAG: hypothetical protein JJE10_04420 [Thermoleophilia bacterium]|nr:hypothetical protein [Thermoleophilia bacterium]
MSTAASISPVPFYLDLAQVGLLVVALGFAAYRFRARFLPGWTGAPGRLVEVVTGFGTLILLAELTGLLGLFRPWVLLPAALLIALLAWLRLSPAGESGGSVPPVPPLGRLPEVIALIVAAVVTAEWGTFASYSLDHGITNFDSVWYHLPFAADMFQSGSVTGFHHTETVFINWFYPQNAEIIQAVGIVFTGNDFLSVFINFSWLAVALLAGWCIGRPYGRPHLTLLAAAVLLVAHTMLVREPGTAKNDIAAVALVLSTVAVLINRGAAARDGVGRISPGWAVAVAGLAIGMAAGTKVTALAPAMLISFAVLVAARRGTRLLTAAVWFGAGFLGGAWWYIRNLAATGNPIPQVESIGPLALPGPERLQTGRPDFNVFHYITDFDIWNEYFFPGLERGFGVLWPLLLFVAVAGAAALVFRGPGRLTRAHGAAALVAISAYLVTPLGAAGPEGAPSAFAINLRFLVPALVMAAVLVPLLPVFTKRWAATALILVLVALLLTGGRTEALYSLAGWRFGLVVAILFVGLPGTVWLFRFRISEAVGGRSPLAWTGLALIAVSLLVAFPLARSYFDNRYADFEPEYGLAAPYRWANDTSDSKIGLAGTTAGFRQYGFFGEDLSNEVTYIGRETPKGGFNAIPDCSGFRRAVNDARLDYLVTSPFLNFDDPGKPIRSPERRWLRGDPALSPVVGPGPVEVWRVDGPLSLRGCHGVKPEKEFIPGLADPDRMP